MGFGGRETGGGGALERDSGLFLVRKYSFSENSLSGM
jgi:hypothetical protein